MSSSDLWSCGEGGDEVSVARFIADQRTFYRVPHAFTCRVLAVSEAWFYKWRDRLLIVHASTVLGDAQNAARQRWRDRQREARQVPIEAARNMP